MPSPKRPPRRPDGQLIERARRLHRPRLSIAKAAEAVDLSPGWWRAVELGYRPVAAGEYVPAVADGDTLARMAQSLGNVTPEQLEEARRPDAAAALRLFATADTASNTLSDTPDATLAQVLGIGLDPDERQRLAAEIAALRQKHVDRFLREARDRAEEISEEHTQRETG